uniref:RNA helicase n=1 Tax=Salarias fasciatus TaxID=181472 RepID=A0A672IKR3_SALFA
MASDSSDEIRERIIELFKPRLKTLIEVDPVLDRTDFIEADEKEQIRQKSRTDGNPVAVGLLLAAVARRPHSPGWFTAFVDALRSAGFSHAADYIQLKLPKPEEEAENDNCAQIIKLLTPTLQDMSTDQVALFCHSRKILTAGDLERVQAETQNRGPRSGARELLERIVKREPGWFSTFVQILRETEHSVLLNLFGGSDDPEEFDEKKSLKKDGRDGDGAATGESCESPTLMEITFSEECHGEDTGLDSGAAAAPSPEKDIVLRDYQMDVAKPALEGKNIIICLPTGSGKTRVAVYITKKHLERRRSEGNPGKVVVLVNKVPLVEQHYSAEFLPFLKKSYRVERVSGDSQLKISFTEIVNKNDIIICTAQILENFLERAEEGEDDGVKLSELSLIVIDECHHTQKGEVYNHIMMRYLKQKHKNRRLKKEQKQPVPLPQILGLTASPGVGGAKKMEKVMDHILSICANLDASKIMTRSLGDFKKEQRKKIEYVEDRKQDPFGDVIKKIMTAIHSHADLSPNCELGSQNYEQWVVQNERKAAKEEDRKVRICADHLQQYSECLNLSNTIRMSDALSFISKFYEEEMKKKTSPDEEHDIEITETERFLFHLFRDNKRNLEELAKNPDYENGSLSKLRTIILKEFTNREAAQGIIFTKTRRSAMALSQWIQENPKFADVGIKSAYIIGGGDQSVVKPMTSAEQKDVLKKFGNGDVNLLIATTVAEEGLDIPACNFVIRYGLVTNEISMLQAMGRGRAEDSSYTLIDVKNSGVAEREFVNEYRCTMMDKAIIKIRALDQEEYDRKITEFQIQAILEEKVRLTKQKQNRIKNESPANVLLRCRGCNQHVCSGEDVQIIEKMHRVNVAPEFKELFIRRENTSLQERLLDYETNGYIACKACGERWGSMMMYKGIECPCLHVKNFVVNISGKNISKCMKWSEVPIKFRAFNYIDHASQVAESSDDEETA